MARSSGAKEPAVTRQQVIESLGPAKTAGLRYVSDRNHGIIRRKKPGQGFYYIGLAGRILHDSTSLRRVMSLVIPPAWKDVWICSDPGGHLQTTGREGPRDAGPLAQ